MTIVSDTCGCVAEVGAHEHAPAQRQRGAGADGVTGTLIGRSCGKREAGWYGVSGTLLGRLCGKRGAGWYWISGTLMGRLCGTHADEASAHTRVTIRCVRSASGAARTVLEGGDVPCHVALMERWVLRR